MIVNHTIRLWADRDGTHWETTDHQDVAVDQGVAVAPLAALHQAGYYFDKVIRQELAQ